MSFDAAAISVRAGRFPPDKGSMLVLGIETTCDETAAAVVRVDADGHGEILSNVVRAQLDDHAPYGGVVPEIAARAHVEVTDLVTAQALREADVAMADIDAVAAAAGPGLIGGVLVGLTTAKAMALVAGKPLVAVNHLEAHALTARLTDRVAFPYLLLLASGGHTQLLAVKGVGDYAKLGTTIDDAIGEAFDKVAKLVGLGYPGGPQVEKRAMAGNPARFALPRPLIGRPDPDFSLSGLKTAVRLEVERLLDQQNEVTEQDVADICASFQMAVADMVADRAKVAIRRFREAHGDPTALVVAGGVGANQTLKAVLQKTADAAGLPLVVPPPKLCTDNGAMIAWAGAERLRLGLTDAFDIAPRARWPLDAGAASFGSGRLGAKA
jgi:N6-L-threonylcarbamoyladenine synthase